MHRNNQEILSPMSPVQSPLGKDYKVGKIMPNYISIYYTYLMY